jgi:hypothetical protein
MKLIYTIALLAFATFAQAQTAVSGAGAIAGSQAGAGAAAIGNDISINFDAVKPLATTTLNYDGDYTIRNVPNVVVPNIYPTAPCMGSSALGGSVAGFGIGGGTSWVYENCEHRENARLLHGMGDVPNAKIALCMQTTMAAHPMCAKPTQQPAKVGTAPRDPVVQGDERQRKDGNLVFDSEGRPWKRTANGEWIQAKL